MTTTDVSRLILAHPDLGTLGGAGLHAQILAIYKKIGDNLSSRILVNLNVLNAATATFEHDFRAPFGELRWDLYLAASTDPYDLTRISSSSSPALSAFTVSATAGFVTTKIDVLNSSGATRNLVLVVHMDPLKLAEGDVQDVDVTTVAPTDGQTMTYDTASGKWKPVSVARFNKIVDPSATAGGYVYTTLEAAIAAASAGDLILVKGTETVTTAITQNIADLTIEWKQGAKTVAGGSITSILNVTGARCRLIAPYFRVDNTTVTYPLKVAAADCRVTDGIVETNAAVTVTAAIQINAGGTRAFANLGILNTTGTVTNDFEDNVGTLRGSFGR